MATEHNKRQTINSSMTLPTGDSWVGIISTGASGGAIVLSGSITVNGTENQFRGNQATYGGAISVGNATLNATDFLLSGNTATTLGGAFKCDGTGSLRMTGGTILNNYAKGVAGVAYVSNGGGTFTDVFVSGNIGSDGGAFYLQSSGMVQIDGGSYTKNRSNSSGGVLYNRNSTCESLIDGAVFTGNTAGSNGGVVFNGASTTISGSTFNGNVAANGGVFYNNAGLMTISTALVSGNTATNGAAAYVVGGSFKVTDSVFSGNTASNGAAVYHNGGTVTVSGTTFSGNSASSYGGALYLQSGFFSVTDALFSGNRASSQGGAAYIKGGTFKAANSIFRNNSASLGAAFFITSTVDFSGGSILNNVGVSSGALYFQSGPSTFTNVFASGNTSTKGDGGVFCAESTVALRVEGGTFTANRAVNGGALLNRSTQTEYLNNAVFTGNTASDKGGAIYARSGTISASGLSFLGNTAGQGGAIYVNEGSVSVENSLFSANITVGQNGGGAVYIGSGASAATFSASEATFSGNSTGSLGGAIALRSTYTASAVTVTGGSFLNNFAGNVGGAAYLGNAGTATFTNVYAAGNTAANNGGAIYTEHSVLLQISGGTYTGNRAANGGVFYNTSNREQTIENTVFSGNTATNAGGAIYASSGSILGTNLLISGNTVGSNTSGNGGGAYVNGGTFAVSGSTFSGNWANQGGAVFFNGGTSTFTNAVVQENTANSGGALYSANSALLEISGGTFSGNAATNGGAFYNTSNREQTIENAVFSGNTATTAGAAIYVNSGSILGTNLLISGNTVGSGTSGNGGGAYVYGGTFAVSGSTFANNWANQGGAAFFNNGISTFSNAVVQGNTANNGGAFYDDSNAALVLSGGTYSGNCAGGNIGGGVAYSKGTLQVSDTTLLNNSAKNVGGAFYVNKGSVTLTDVFASGNTAAQGGVLYSEKDGTTEISGGTFAYNCATSDGGAIYNRGSLTIGNVIFDGNSSTKGGGAIYNTGSVTIDGVITLKQSSDTLAGSGTWSVDASAFTADWNKVIEAKEASLWNGVTITTSSGFEQATLGDDLYVYTAGKMIPTAIVSADGKEESIVVCGESFSGVGAKFTEFDTVKGYGATNFVLDGYTGSGLYVSNGTFATDATVAIKNSTFNGNVYGFSGSAAADVNLTVLVENSFANRIYTAGSASFTGEGIITLKVTGSSITQRLTHTASDAANTAKAFVMEISGSTVDGEVWGTGSSTKEMTVQGTTISMTDSYAGTIIAGAGNTITGNAAIILAGSTVANGVTKGSNIGGSANLTVTGADTTIVSGTISGMDSITVDAGATLSYSGAGITVTNNGTLAFSGNGSITNGYSYADFSATGSGTVTATDGAWLDGSRAYYFCVVDSSITAASGTEIEVVIEGATTKAVVGTNAFTSTADAKAAHADAKLVVVNETISGGNLGGGTNVLEEGVKITGNLYGASSGTVSSVDLTLRGASSSATVLGGGSSLASVVDGNITLKLEDATIDRIVYGGGQSGTVTGSITTTVSGDSVIGKNFYGGSLITCDAKATEFDAYSAGDVTVNITGGTFGGHIIGGSRVNGVNNKSENTLSQCVESVTLNISGGTFNSRASVFAGGYVVGNGTKDKTDLEVLHGVNLTLNTDMLTTTAASGVYGGALAGTFGTALVSRDLDDETVHAAVTITVEDGHYSAIYGAGWAESNATSLVSGGIAIDVNGGSIGNLYAGGNNDTSGAKANVTGDAVITLAGGTVDNLYASSKWKTSQIKGNTEVNITGGTITGMLSGWTPRGLDAVTGTQTLDLDASVSCGAVMGFDVWEVAENATLTSALASTVEDDYAIDLDGVTLDFGSATDGWNIATAESGIINLADATIKLGSVAWAWNETDNCWYGDTNQWKLSVENKTLTLSKLA